MTVEEARNRVKELTALLERYNYEYYILNQSSVSDAEFDRLMGELKLLEEEFPGLKNKNSPTQRVGGTVQSEFKKILHKRLMKTITMDVLKDAANRLLFDMPLNKPTE